MAVYTIRYCNRGFHAAIRKGSERSKAIDKARA